MKKCQYKIRRIVDETESKQMQLDVTRQKGVAKVKSKMATLASDWLKTYLSSLPAKTVCQVT